MKLRFRLSLLAVVAVLALIAAACGSGDDAEAPAAPTQGTEEPAPLPPNSNPDESPPPAAGACLEGEPDCNDTAQPGEVPQDLPPPFDEPITPGGSQGALVDGGLTVTEALNTDATGVIAVKGFLLVDEQGEARLCETLAESLPPQCGGASIPVTNYEEVLGAPVLTEQGISWTDDRVSFLGEITDGTLVVNPFVAQ